MQHEKLFIRDDGIRVWVLAILYRDGITAISGHYHNGKRVQETETSLALDWMIQETKMELWGMIKPKQP